VGQPLPLDDRVEIGDYRCREALSMSYHPVSSSRMIAPLAAALALGSFLLSACAPAQSPIPTATESLSSNTPSTEELRDSTRSVIVDGLDRNYLLHIPPELDTNRPAPVVLVFHGFGSSAQAVRSQTSFDDAADTNGFIVVYPIGTGSANRLSWNAGECCASAVEEQVDETSFVHGILSDLETIANVDSKRVYATGYSNGGMLSYRLACEMSATFAAVAPVAGVLLSSPCQPEHPVSLIHIHGLSDNVVFFIGGEGACRECPSMPPVQTGVETWALLNGCSPVPQGESTGLITLTAYVGCRDGAAVQLYTIEGVGHAWPVAPDLATTETVWAFFAAHPKP